MQCSDIKGLTFDHSSVAAIDQIREIQNFGSMLTVLMGTSVMTDIFVGRHGLKKPLAVAWGISQNEWFQWSQAMRSVPSLVRWQVRDIAFDQYTKHLSGVEHEFWRAVMNGCD
ncbi:MAG: hypothetical protein AABY83_06725 [Pseudomonadota bacterium]